MSLVVLTVYGYGYRLLKTLKILYPDGVIEQVYYYSYRLEMSFQGIPPKIRNSTETYLKLKKKSYQTLNKTNIILCLHK